jgi:ABC-type cobalt transport system substrate-binding protein
LVKSGEIGSLFFGVPLLLLLFLMENMVGKSQCAHTLALVKSGEIGSLLFGVPLPYVVSSGNGASAHVVQEGPRGQFAAKS